jgi:O-antigen/teichoic acid export membrane protein
MGTALTILMLAISPLAAWYFDDDRLLPLFALTATTLIINAAGQQVRVSAEKTLHFRPVVLVDTCSTVLCFAATVLAAMLGWGVYSLAFGSVLGAFSGTVLARLFMANSWRPQLGFKIEDVRTFIGFGGSLVANNIVNQFNASVDLLIGGRMLAASQLGLYSVPRNLALQLQFLVNPIITRVAFPLISQVQTDQPRVKAIYLQTVNMTASINAPLYLGAFFFAQEIVNLLLGRNWTGSVDILRILAVWGYLRSTGNPVGSLLMGMGRAVLALKWNGAILFVMPPLLWIGSNQGAEGLAWTLLAFSFVMFVPGWYFLVHRLCQAGLLEYAKAALAPLVLALSAIFPAYSIATRFEGDFIRLTVGIALAAPFYVAISFLGNRQWVRAMLELAGKK